MPEWYVAYTNPKCEERARLGLVDRGFIAYLPATKRLVRSGRQRIAVERPLFPRYLFIGFGPQNSWYRVRSTNGIADILMAAGKPYEVPARIIADLQSAELAGAFDETRPKPSPFSVGQQVKIIGGALAGFAAEIMRQGTHDRFVVLCRMFGRPSPIEVGLADLAEAC